MGQVADIETLMAALEPLRGQYQVVTTNGCFDILHVGHLRYLQACKGLGDILVVAVNSDRSVRALKGPTRPIVPEAERAELIAGLACVDFVVIFDEDTPETLLRRIHPDMHAKGAQYTPETLPERQTLEAMGTRMAFIPMVENRSTTNLIQAIQASTAQQPAC